MAKKFKSQLYRTLTDAMSELMQRTAKQADEVVPQATSTVAKTKRPRIVKPPHQGAEKVYEGFAKAIQPVEFKKSTIVAETLKDLDHSLNHMEQISGKKIPAWNEQMMRKIIEQYPDAFNRTPMPTNPVYPTYKSNDFGITDYFTPEDYAKIKGITTINTTPVGWTPSYQTSPVVSAIPDYFKPQQYRGIDNIDTMFEQAGSMSALGADHTARQFLSAGLKDVAAIARGAKPTSFKYKPHYGIVPRNVIEEIVERRNAPEGTVEWLMNINAKDPNIGLDYLDLYAKYPAHFQKMYDLDGNLIK